MALSVTVIIPAFNAASTIVDAVRSAFAQSCAALEILVIDDGSTDDTAQLATAAGARVLSQSNAGVSAARNFGIKEARGEWLAFLDADDRWLPERLAKQHAAIKAVPEARFLFSDMRRERDGSIIEPRWMVERKLYQNTPKYRAAEHIVAFDGKALALRALEENFIPTSSVLVHRDAVPSTGFNPTLRYCEDLELWLRILADHDAAAVEESLIVYRLHSSSASAQWETILRGDIALYQRIRIQPTGYSEGLDLRARELIQPRRRALGRHLLRSGSYAKAAREFGGSLRERPSLPALLWLCIAGALSLPGAKALHTWIRTLKKS
jgi:glycosyltransferase involved in cell wall biosynthesis